MPIVAVREELMEGQIKGVTTRDGRTRRHSP